MKACIDCVGSYVASTCFKSCGAGKKTATFKITTAAVGGKACSAASGATKSQACTVKACGCPAGKLIINGKCDSIAAKATPAQSSARAAGLSAALALAAAATLALAAF